MKKFRLFSKIIAYINKQNIYIRLSWLFCIISLIFNAIGTITNSWIFRIISWCFILLQLCCLYTQVKISKIERSLDNNFGFTEYDLKELVSLEKYNDEYLKKIKKN